MKSITKFLITLSTVFAITGCSTNSGSNKNQVDRFGGILFDFEYSRVPLFFKLTKENFFSQIEDIEKEDRYEITFNVVYSFEEGKEFVNGRDKIPLTFPKDGYQYFNDGQFNYCFEIDLVSNYTTIFNEFDYLMIGAYRCVNKNVVDTSNKLLVSRWNNTTPFVFKNDVALPVDCYNAYCLFYNPNPHNDVYSYVVGYEAGDIEVTDDVLQKFNNDFQFTEEKILTIVDLNNNGYYRDYGIKI